MHGVGSGAAGASGAPPRPGVVLVTGSAWLEERVRGCAVAAGTSLEVVHEVPGPGVALPTAALEVWGADALDHAAGAPSTTTPRVVVAAEAAPDAVWRAALVAGARGVLQLPAGEADLVDALLAATDDRDADGVVVGVLGVCGGAGASALAVALARAGARAPARRASAGEVGAGGVPGPVLLADLDALGGGADVLTGLEDAAGLRWDDLAGVRGTLRPDVLEGTLPRRWGVDVLAPVAGPQPAAPRVPGGGPVPPAASAAVVSAARRSHALVVLDLPRGLHGVEHLLPLVGPVVVVLPGQVRAGVAAGRVLAHLERLVPGADVRLVVRAPSRRGAVRGPGVRPVEVARALGRPLAGVVPHDAYLASEELRGRPFPTRDGALTRWADDVVAGLCADGPDHRVSAAGVRGARVPAVAGRPVAARTVQKVHGSGGRTAPPTVEHGWRPGARPRDEEVVAGTSVVAARRGTGDRAVADAPVVAR